MRPGTTWRSRPGSRTSRRPTTTSSRCSTRLTSATGTTTCRGWTTRRSTRSSTRPRRRSARARATRCGPGPTRRSWPPARSFRSSTTATRSCGDPTCRTSTSARSRRIRSTPRSALADSPPPGPLLAVEGLGVEFVVGGRTITAADDVSFEIRPAEILALVGEAGSGKSVTALSLMGLLGREARVGGRAALRASHGPPIELLSADPATLRAVRGGRIGAVFQDPFSTFNPVMRIGRQIVEALDAHPQTRGRDAPGRTRELLARVGLDEPERVYRSFPHELSGGQLQRAMIAMAISGEPDLLIADEPTTALDVTVQAGILDLLHELRDDMGTAILLITHDMGVVADLADDVIVMRDGHVIETGPAERVFAAPELPYTRELLAAVPRVDGGVAAVPAVAEAPAAAEVRDVTITYRTGRRPFTAVDGVSLTVPAGQTVGLVGESGSG